VAYFVGEKDFQNNLVEETIKTGNTGTKLLSNVLATVQIGFHKEQLQNDSS